MKRISSALAALLCAVSVAAYAANITLTPIAPPTETGENSLSSQQVMDMARIKPGMGSVTLAVSTSAASGTLNNAAGAITLTAATAGASGATPTVVTLANSKVGASDLVDCWIDQTGATAGSVLSCNSHVTAGQVVFSIYSATPTALTSSAIVLYFVTFTSGNPN